MNKTNNLDYTINILVYDGHRDLNSSCLRIYLLYCI